MSISREISGLHEGGLQIQASLSNSMEHPILVSDFSMKPLSMSTPDTLAILDLFTFILTSLKVFGYSSTIPGTHLASAYFLSISTIIQNALSVALISVPLSNLFEASVDIFNAFAPLRIVGGSK